MRSISNPHFSPHRSTGLRRRVKRRGVSEKIVRKRVLASEKRQLLCLRRLLCEDLVGSPMPGGRVEAQNRHERARRVESAALRVGLCSFISTQRPPAEQIVLLTRVQVDAGKISDRDRRREKQLLEASLRRRRLDVTQRQSILDRERSTGGPGQRAEVRAGSESRAEIVSDGSDVGAGRAGDLEDEVGRPPGLDGQLVDLDMLRSIGVILGSIGGSRL